MEYNCRWPEHFHNLRNDRLEDALVRFVCNAIFKRDIDRVALAFAASAILLSARAREVFAKFVKRARHDAVSRVERFFDAVTVVAIDVDIQHAGIYAQKLQYSKHYVIDIAEAAGLLPLCVVKTACPVDANVCMSR